MIEHVFPQEMMKEREKQLSLALLDCAGVYYDTNYTQDKILGNPIQIVDGKEYSILDIIGKKRGCSHTEIVEYWANIMPEDEREAFVAFSDVNNVIARYIAGERLITHRFWTFDVLGNRMLAEQKVRLYEDITNGDILGLVYVSNAGEQDSLRKQYEEASSKVSFLQEMSENVPGGYHRCSLDDGYTFQFISKSFEQIVGYTSDEIAEKFDNKFINMVYKEDLPRFAGLEAGIAAHGDGSAIYRIRRGDGELRWMQDSTLLIERNGEKYFQCSIADITDFVNQQEEYARQKAEFDELATNIPSGYHRCTTEDGFGLDFVSDSFIDIVGWSREELKTELDNRFINLIVPEDRHFFLSHEPILVRDGKISLAYRVRHKDGGYRWVQDSTMRVKQGGKEYYQCILSDITEFVHRQEEMVKQNMDILKEKTLLEKMEENMPSGYHRCKAEKGFPFTYIGKHFTDIVGFSKEEIERDFDNLFCNLIWDEDVHTMSTYENMLNMRGQGDVYDTSIYRLKHKNGGYRWVTDSTMFVDLGEDSFFQSTVADITEYIEELDKARKQAEASNQAKSTFLFNASHDIRTPMNAIKGFAHIIEQNVDNTELVRDTIKKIKQASDTLMTLMNDVLDLARIEKGKEELNNQPLSLCEHSKNLYEMFVSSMCEKDINFSMDCTLEHNLALADSLKLERIGMNMLSNAKKFTPAGGAVTFGVKELSFDGERVTYKFYCKDTGIGMSKEFLSRAFEQFEREHTSTETGVAGSGLGLAIIQKLVELMGGRVEISSELGHGTEISAYISFKPVNESDIITKNTDIQSINMAGKRVLLVEDNAFNREIARYILEDIKFTVDEAENGLACVNKLINSPDGYYDLVLMDIQMPVMDGYKATEEIRKLDSKRISSVPIIAMTANAFDEDKQKCLDCGMNGHIGKPIDIETLISEITKVL